MHQFPPPPVFVSISDPMKQFWKPISSKGYNSGRITSDMSKGVVFI